MPAAQAVHEVAPAIGANVPGAHDVHEPADVTNVPGAQAVHGVQLVAPAADQAPSAHGVHAVAPVPSAE